MSAPAMLPFDALELPLSGRSLVEASAGTGKTHAITTLVLRLLLERGLPIDRILVVTFTEAATAELRRRVRDRLTQALAALELPGRADDDVARVLDRALAEDGRDEVRRTLRRALLSVDEAAISTIHGFCQRALKDSAFDSGMRFDAELTGDLSLVKNEVLHDAWVRVAAEADEPTLAMLGSRGGVTLEAMRELVDKVTRASEVQVLGDPAHPAVAVKRRLLDTVLAELPQRKEQRRLIGFDDLLTSLARALAGPGGAALAEQVRRRHPAALVDEFQDTDGAQWSIFDRIWGGASGPLVLIGDPKQAIYRFRGADVFAYLAAAASVAPERRFTMGTNWRSDPTLVRAVHAVFTRMPRPMLLADIGYPDVAARSGATDAFGAGESLGRAPLRVLFAPRTGRTLTKAALGARVPDAVAAEVARLIAEGRIDGRALHPGDVAVLSRKHLQSFEVQRALFMRGIPAVVHGDMSVFATEDARDLELILAAAADPSDDGAIRAALITAPCGLDAAALAEMDRDAAGWQRWAGMFREIGVVWAQRGVAHAWRTFARAVELGKRVLALPDGERHMTNLAHLVELCHLAERSQHLGPRALIAWLAARLGAKDARAEETQIRLESDERAVQLTTVHRSKGLEYPVVLLPYLWDIAQLGRPDAIESHDADGRAALTLLSGGETKEELAALPAARAAERERLAEELRLAYVALTRAKHRAVLVWGGANGFEGSGLGYLLHGDPAAADGEVEAIRAHLKKRTDEQCAPISARWRRAPARPWKSRRSRRSRPSRQRCPRPEWLPRCGRATCRDRSSAAGAWRASRSSPQPRARSRPKPPMGATAIKRPPTSRASPRLPPQRVSCSPIFRAGRRPATSSTSCSSTSTSKTRAMPRSRRWSTRASRSTATTRAGRPPCTRRCALG
jgi:exodeoxyribonuclease V beta subunit